MSSSTPRQAAVRRIVPTLPAWSGWWSASRIVPPYRAWPWRGRGLSEAAARRLPPSFLRHGRGACERAAKSLLANRFGRGYHAPEPPEAARLKAGGGVRFFPFLRHAEGHYGDG